MKRPEVKNRICRAGKETKARLVNFENKYGYSDEIKDIETLLVEIYPLNKIHINKLRRRTPGKNIDEYKEELREYTCDEYIVEVDLEKEYEIPECNYFMTTAYKKLYSIAESLYNKLKEEEKDEFKYILKLIERMTYQSYRICRRTE